MDKKIASFILRFRTPLLVIITGLTVFFGWRALHLKLTYDFEKLLPRNHSYVKTYQEFQQVFGGANLITIEIAVKEGDIFTHETLGKIRKITDEISFVPGIDRSKVISIGAKKIKETRATSWGIEKISLLWPDVPSTPESLQALRHVCMSDETIFGSLVSVNGKAALIMADVYEKGVNYQQVYGNIRKILDQEIDSKTTIHVSGEPIVVGEVIKAMPKILWIFGISMVLVLGILYLHFMNLRIPLLHISVSGATTIWGLGMMELLHFTLNPMTTIVPFLLMVISISHANQLIIRYAEKSSLLGGGGVAAAEEALGEILIPGISALGTNLAGFAVLAVIPIGTIQELAITASIGMCCAVLRDLTLLPILLCRIPNLRATQNANHAAAGGMMERALARVSHSIFNKTERVVVLGIMVILFAAGTYYARHLDIGSLHPGSPLFWEKSRYNQDTKKINEDFFGTDAMSVVIQGKPGILREPEVLRTMEKYQRFISGVPNVGGAISVVDLVKNVNQKIHEDDPVWYTVPATPKEVGSNLYLVYTGGDSGDFDIFGTTELDSANIRVFFKDHTVTTINRALDETKSFIAQNPLKDAKYRLAGGIIGVLAAVGEVLQKFHLQATLLSYGIICLVVFLTFRSFFAVALICIPLGMVSMMSFAFMKLVRIELDVNTLPIAALGMGLCVDYGIYLYGKIRSEADGGGTFQEVLDRAMVSCGSAVIITGTTFTLGVILWVFSDLRFQATMGVLLAFMFVMNMVTSILVLPILIDLFKPKDIFSSIEKSNRVLVAKKEGGEVLEGWQQAAIKVRPDIN